MTNLPSLIAYAAGLFDGEGTVRIQTTGGIALEIQMTDEEPVDRMEALFGGTKKKEGRALDSGRTAYRWSVYGENAVNAATEMLPYSVNKRRQLEVILSYFDYIDRPSIKDVALGQLLALRLPNAEPISWDLETMGLMAAKHNLLTCAMQFGNDEEGIQTLYKDNSKGEEALLLDARAVLESAPWTMGYNSKRFDIPFLNTRLAKYEHRPVFLGSHSDVSEMYMEYTGRKKRTSLLDMANELGLTDEEVHKTPIDWPTWYAANDGEDEAMDYVVEHGKMDVILTKRGYDAIISRTNLDVQ